jgi:broad specificity phosphatase PhoE
MMISHKPFYFIRHGETDWNREHIFMGQKDIPLNQYGIEQAQKAAKNLADVEIASIATSPLKRAAKTAEIIAKAIKRPITIIDELRECCWGTKEGQAADDETFFKKWLEGHGPAGAETVQEFDKRVLSALNQVLKLPEPVLIVAHGGVYGAIRRQLSLPVVYLHNCMSFYHIPPQHTTHPWFVHDLAGEVINNE